MRRALLLTALALLVILAPVEEAGAGGPLGALESGTHESAGVARGFLCGLFVTLTTDSHATISNSGIQTLQCHGDFDPALLGLTRAVKIEGLPCFLHFGGMTTDSQLIATPGGKMHLHCRG